MSARDDAAEKRAKFWQDRAEGFQRRLEELRQAINESVGAEEICPEDAWLKAIEMLRRQIRTQQGYLWALVQMQGGKVVLPDARLMQWMDTGASLRVTHRAGESEFEAVTSTPPTTKPE